MTRIPLLLSDARLAFSLVSVLSACVVGCLEQGERAAPPDLVLFPNTASPGSQLGILATAEGVRFDSCGNLDNNSVRFEPKIPDKTSTMNSIEVHSIGYLDTRDTTPETLRFYIKIDQDAKIGDYAVFLDCDDNTTLKGSFHVQEAGEELSLVLKPDTLPAGVQHQSVDLQLDPPSPFSFFDENLTQVVFGNGDSIQVVEQRVINARHLMTVDINIPLTTPQGEMDVTVVNGSRVARGKFTVGESIEPTLAVQPREIKRPLPDTGVPKNYTLTIENPEQFLSFEEPLEDAGILEQTGTQVSFPYGENGKSPGLEVLKVDVVEPSKLTANILVHDYAHLGATRLRVQTGDQYAETALTVLPTEGAQTLRFNRDSLVRGAKDQRLVATAINFEFRPPISVDCLDPGCDAQLMQQVQDIPNMKQILLAATIEPSYAEEFARIEIKSQSTTVRESLRIDDSEGPSLSIENNLSLTQGVTWSTLKFTLTNGTFEPNASVRALPRSGIRIISNEIDETKTEMNVALEIAKDAPVGPALLIVDSGEHQFEAGTEIQPSGTVPAISVYPHWITEGRGASHLVVEAEGFTFDRDTTTFKLDDPAIEIVDTAFSEDDPPQVTLQIAVSPLARTDMIVLYARSGEHIAAGTIRVIKKGTLGVASVSPSSINRGEKTKITVRTETFQFGDTIAQTPDNIGLSISAVDVDGLDARVATFNLEAQTDGPGGWIGIILTSEWQTFVVPMYIATLGEDTLTMRVTPENLKRGSQETLTLDVSPFTPATEVSEAQSGLKGAYFSWPEIKGPTEANIIADIAYDINAPEEGIPIFLTTSQGAAVGYVDVDNVTWQSARENAPWKGILGQGTVIPLEIEPAPSPSLIHTTPGREGYGDATLKLVSTNGLDTVEPTPTGDLWLLEDKNRLAILTPSEDSTGLLGEVRVKPIGGRLLELLEGQTKAIESNPCDTPILLRGNIEDAFDIDRIAFNTISCRLLVSARSRALSLHPWRSPDLWLERQNLSGESLERATGFWGDGPNDPALFIDDGDLETVMAIGSQSATTGDYLINIHRPDSIREIGRTDSFSYIAIAVDPVLLADNLNLELYDAKTGSLLESTSLSGTPISSDVLVIGSKAMPGVDVVNPIAVLGESTSLALSLKRGTEVVDALQIGGENSGLGEGTPLSTNASDPETICSRVAAIDTDDNATDFVCGWYGSPLG